MRRPLRSSFEAAALADVDQDALQEVFQEDPARSLWKEAMELEDMQYSSIFMSEVLFLSTDNST